MRIVVDLVQLPSGQMAEICLHTDRAAWNQVNGIPGHALPVDMIDFLALMKAGTIPVIGTGHEVVSQHPNAGGKSRLQFALTEIVRLNDAAARATLNL